MKRMARWFVALATALIAASPAWSQAPKAEPTFRDCLECPEMVVVPPGSFVFGAPGSRVDELAWDRPIDGARILWESPDVRVTFARSFALGKTAVSRAQFAAFVRETGFQTKPGCILWTGDWVRTADKSWSDPGIPQTDAHPVVCVDREEAMAYVAWLSGKTGRRYSLPSEAMFEYASRAGGASAYPWGDTLADACRYANVADATLHGAHPARAAIDCDDRALYTAPVGSYAANRWGLHDMTGNVWQWVADCWNPSHATANPDGSAVKTGFCAESPLRGGAYGTGPLFLRSSARGGPDKVSGTHQSWIGFRVAIDNLNP